MAQGNGEKKHKLNALDVLLIIVLFGVIAMVAASIVRANPGIVSGGDKEVSYVIQVKNIPEVLKESIAIGDKLYDDESGQLLGEVTAFSTEQSFLTGYGDNSVPVVTPIDGNIDMLITLKVEVWVEKNAIKIDGFRLSIGKDISCHSQNLAVTGKCVSITDIA